MYIWKGAFAPTFRKHHGGTAADHVELEDNPSVVEHEGKPHVKVTFSLETYEKEDNKYKTLIPVTDDQVANLNDEAVIDLIVDQLSRPHADRTWVPVGDEADM